MTPETCDQDLRPFPPVAPAATMGIEGAFDPAEAPLATLAVTEKESDIMVQRLIVPADGSPESCRAIDVAASMARAIGVEIDVVTVVYSPHDVSFARGDLDACLRSCDIAGVDINLDIRLSRGSVADEIEAALVRHPGSAVVMSSLGRGRSAAIVGSVTEEVLTQTSGPVMLVGPKVTPPTFDGPVVVSVDGSNDSEIALPLAASWSALLGATPWVVHVVGERDLGTTDGDVIDSAYPARLARDMADRSGRDAAFEELHDAHPAAALASFAERMHASLIVASSHGRTGLSRLALGSVTSGMVREATCPVLVTRVPQQTDS